MAVSGLAQQAVMMRGHSQRAVPSIILLVLRHIIVPHSRRAVPGCSSPYICLTQHQHPFRNMSALLMAADTKAHHLMRKMVS